MEFVIISRNGNNYYFIDRKMVTAFNYLEELFWEVHVWELPQINKVEPIGLGGLKWTQFYGKNHLARAKI